MTIPLVPFEGRMSYCLIKCVQMVLAHQGHDYPLPWLECVSGEPFGFAYIRTGQAFFAVNGHEYHRAGEHLLQTLNYTYTYTSAADDAAALVALEDGLRDGPVVAGMLDMGFLTYAPTHQQARGADHAVVVLALRPDTVLVHDPDGYPAVPLPLADFLEAWKRDIYTGKPYGLWRIGAQGVPPDDETIWQRTLARARENFARPTEALGGGVTLVFGPEGMRTLAADMRADPTRELGGMAYFGWRVSAQRCLDSAIFLRPRLPDAAAIRWEQCQVYGALQQASAADARAALPALLERLAEYEERFIAALG
jgi:Butirosin biosynthesis protein H, N-terminal